MNKKLALRYFGILLLVGLGLAGCQSKAGTYGQALSQGPVVSIGDLLSQPKHYEGKTVKLEGVITQECPSGGWFFLKDQNAPVFVNLHPSDFAIPQAVGAKTVAEGKVMRQGAQIEVVGTGVELK